MILPDHQIRGLCLHPAKRFTGKFRNGEPGDPIFENGVPLIEPYSEAQLQPASYDVQLGNEFLIFERAHHTELDLDNPVDITKKVIVEDDGFFVLHPGEFALGVTREVVHMPNHLVSRIEGKSSMGRFGVMVHVTAGFIDPGFNGPVTLEMAAFHPYAVKLRPGKLVAQLAFETMVSECEHPYEGRYQDASGVEPSKYGKDN